MELSKNVLQMYIIINQNFYNKIFTRGVEKILKIYFYGFLIPPKPLKIMLQ